MPYSTAIDSSLNKALFGGTAYTAPGTLYAALSSTTPTAAGGNVTEPVGNAYARVTITNNNTNWVAATGQPGTGQAQANGTAIAFAQATGSWGTETYLCFYDALTAGNLVAFGALGTAQTIGNGDTLSFAIQAVVVTLQ